jgi:hypothetical protein
VLHMNDEAVSIQRANALTTPLAPGRRLKGQRAERPTFEDYHGPSLLTPFLHHVLGRFPELEEPMIKANCSTFLGFKPVLPFSAVRYSDKDFDAIFCRGG